MKIGRLNYRFGLKAFLPRALGNEWFRSGDKSQMRVPVKPKNFWRAKVTMIRLTKLIRSDSLPLGGKCNITGKGLSLMWERFRIYLFPLIIIKCHSNKEFYTQRSKVTHIGIKGTMGSSKGQKSYELGGLVVDLSRRRLGIRFYSSQNIIKPSGSDRLKELREINKNDVVNAKVIHVIADLEILTLAYETIKRSSGNITSGDNGKALNGVNYELIQKISSEIKAGKFNFSPARRGYIPKHNNDELRLLKVVSPGDKIVQTAMRMVLEAIFEPSFLDVSYGFRPGKGCHTALKKVKVTFSNVNLVIEGGIFKCYDTIDHRILLDLVKKRVSCEKTLALIKKFVRNPYLENGRLVYPKIGIFQSSSLRPLLCNIYLHEFDLFMEGLKKSFCKGLRKRKTPVYRRIQYLLQQKNTFKFDEKRRLTKRLRSLPRKDFSDKNFRRLQYTRYADGFLVGITGTYEECVKIRHKIFDFLFDHLSLNLNLDKTQVTHLDKNNRKVFETIIWGNQETEKKMIFAKRGNKRLKVRSISKARLEVPIDSIFDKSVENGFFKRTKTGKFVPTACRRVTHLDHSEILKFYNQKIRGILNYYSFADNKKSMGSFVHGLKHSCALTLALKLKLRRRAPVFKKFGKTLKCPNTKVELCIPNSFRSDETFYLNPEKTLRLFIENRWNNIFTRTNLTKIVYFIRIS